MQSDARTIFHFQTDTVANSSVLRVRFGACRFQICFLRTYAPKVASTLLSKGSIYTTRRGENGSQKMRKYVGKKKDRPAAASDRKWLRIQLTALHLPVPKPATSATANRTCMGSLPPARPRRATVDPPSPSGFCPSPPHAALSVITRGDGAVQGKAAGSGGCGVAFGA